MKIKLHSVLAFCGLTTIAAVYYCYYLVSNKKRKQNDSLNKSIQSQSQEKSSFKNSFINRSDSDNLSNSTAHWQIKNDFEVAEPLKTITNKDVNNSRLADLQQVNKNFDIDRNSKSAKEDGSIYHPIEEDKITPIEDCVNEANPGLNLLGGYFKSQESMCDETNVTVNSANPETESVMPCEQIINVKTTETMSDLDVKKVQSNEVSPNSDFDESNISWASIVEETLKEHSADTSYSNPSENSVYYVNPKSPLKTTPKKSQLNNQQKNLNSADLSRKSASKQEAKLSSKTVTPKTSAVKKSQSQITSSKQPPLIFHTSQYQKQMNSQHELSNNSGKVNSYYTSQHNNNNNKLQTNSNSSYPKSAKNSQNRDYKKEDSRLLVACDGNQNGNVSDCSNQENDPDSKRKSNSKKSNSPGNKHNAYTNGSGSANGYGDDHTIYGGAVNGVNSNGCYNGGSEIEQMGTMMEQIYLNDPSVISVISPNFSDPDSAVISCGESSLTSITYLQNGIPSPSEASTDSGLMRSSGSPEYFNPPLEEYLSWEVEIPTHVGGKIIGKAGRNVKELRDKTGCKVIIKDIENSRRKQLLVVRGTLEQIQVCHRLLEKKFRKEIDFDTGLFYTMEGLAGFLGFPMAPQFPTASPGGAAVVAGGVAAATGVAAGPTTQILPAAHTYLQLPQSAYFDVLVCSVKTAGHFFLQQPTHNSFFNLDRLHDCMRDCYSNPTVPELPYPIALGTISAAFLDGKWCRSQVVGVTDDENVITVRFLDMGGYREMPRHNVKQIRTDFLSLPFQATEVFLSEVTPPNDEPDFSAEATKFLEELISQSGTPQAFLKGWNMSDMPLVDLIVRRDGKFESVAQILIDHGYAVRLEMATV